MGIMIICDYPSEIERHPSFRSLLQNPLLQKIETSILDTTLLPKKTAHKQALTIGV